MYRSPPTTCARHPLTASVAQCTSCAVNVCEQCGTWIALRFRCLDCAARHRRWKRIGGWLGRVALMLPLVATLFGAGAMIAWRPAVKLERTIIPVATIQSGGHCRLNRNAKRVWACAD